MVSSPLPWLWVIEALASFKQVDASILKELVKKVPEISGDLGKDAREMINFWILETIASQQVGNNRIVSPTTISKKSFGPLDRCEDVVRHILCERTDDVEMFKPLLQSFIAQKRAVLPKCTLLKLKDAILEGKHPIFKSLKAKSGLSTSSESIIDRPVMNGATYPSEGNNLTSLNTENMNCFSPKNCQNGKLTPSKRDLNNLESEDQGLRSGNSSPSFYHEGDSNLPISKKLKHVRDEAPETLVSLNPPIDEAKDVGNHCSDVERSNSAPPNQAHQNTFDQTNTVVETSQPTPSKIMSHDKSHTKNNPRKSLRNVAKEVGNHCSDVERSNSAPPNKARRNTSDQTNTVVKKSQPTPSKIMSQDKSHTTNNPLKSQRDVAKDVGNHCSDVGRSNYAPPNDARRNTSDQTNTVVEKSQPSPSKIISQDKSHATNNPLKSQRDVAKVVGNRCSDVVKSNSAPPKQARRNTSDQTNTVVEKSQPTPSKIMSHDKSLTRNIPFNSHRATDHNPENECSSDSDGFQKEGVNISMRKSDFLSSQCTFTEDSISCDDLSELNICVKCEKGDDLLVCSANACPIVVHQSCLGTLPSFDSNGKFFCPYCSYSRAITDYLKTKKKTELLRKDLAAFMGSGSEHRPRKIAKETLRLEQNKLSRDDNVTINDQIQQKHVSDIGNCKSRGQTSDTPRGEPLRKGVER